MSERPLIAVTLGDPSGIGPEVVAKAWAQPVVHEHGRLVLIGDAAAVRQAVEQVGSAAEVRTVSSVGEASGDGAVIEVLEVEGVAAAFPTGELSLESARASHAWVERAAGLAISGEIAAMTTASVNKEGWRAAGIIDTGHQEVLKRMSGSSHVATMLVSGELRCMHLSTHLSLAEACAFVTREHVLEAIRLTHDHFMRWGFESPRIGVAALNPHGSDGGLIGTTEQDEIAPAIADAVGLGIDARGPVPADSVFNQAIDGQHDVVVVMYHDQGHIPIKVHGFEESVSVNLGLPFVRTSVDHGTAFDIAGQNRAQATSMVEAILLATRLAVGRPLDAAVMSDGAATGG